MLTLLRNFETDICNFLDCVYNISIQVCSTRVGSYLHLENIEVLDNSQHGLKKNIL